MNTRKKIIKEIAESLFKLKKSNSFPVDARIICSTLGIDVNFITFKNTERKSTIYGFSEIVNDSYTIYVNTFFSPKEQLYTIAHEMGLLILHPEWVKSHHYTVRKNGKKIDTIYHEEAHYFALLLLMPSSLFNDSIKKFPASSLSDIMCVEYERLSDRIFIEEEFCHNL